MLLIPTIPFIDKDSFLLVMPAGIEVIKMGKESRIAEM